MEFLKSVKKELMKVKWLKKKEIFQQFAIVNLVSIAIIAYFGLIDFVFLGLKNLFN